MDPGQAERGLAVRWVEKLPSLGFVGILLTNLGLVLFLAWGFRTPPLHRIWELHHELKIGKRGKLKAEDRALLDAAMKRHARLARELLSENEKIGLVSANASGWLETPDATIIRSKAASACSMLLQVKIPEDALPLKIEVRGRSWERRVTVQEQGTTKLDLPDLEGDPEVITLKVASKDSRDEVATLGLRVSFECRGPKTAKQPEAQRD